MSNKILVWDFPTRTFHWLLAISFVGAFITGDSERYREIHLLLGYTMLALIGFRLIWGIVGTRYARFSSFWFKPSAVVDYVRSMFQGKPQHYVGHNPAGSVAIFLLLGLGLLSGLSGLALYNEIGGEWLEELHELSANAMLAVVIVHIVGVFFSSFLHRENLARAMVIGDKTGEPAQGIQNHHAWLGLLLLAGVVAMGYAYLYKNWAPPGLTQVSQQPVATQKRQHDD
ncbi:MAG: cytochrome b/b6 domain-containing protein [Burkholderiales bacterium]|nr:cytochrome b/b6 domain-containing protein [Burkholderiales bacterium]